LFAGQALTAAGALGLPRPVFGDVKQLLRFFQRFFRRAQGAARGSQIARQRFGARFQVAVSAEVHGALARPVALRADQVAQTGVAVQRRARNTRSLRQVAHRERHAGGREFGERLFNTGAAFARVGRAPSSAPLRGRIFGSFDFGMFTAVFYPRLALRRILNLAPPV
jgi:hypothetical protein